MTKRKKQEDELTKIEKEEHEKKRFLPEAMLWEWKWNRSNMKAASTTFEAAKLKREILAKEKEILELRLKLFKDVLKAQDSLQKSAKESYDSMKERLEEHIGYPLSECVIDDETLEIKKVSELQAKVED